VFAEEEKGRLREKYGAVFIGLYKERVIAFGPTSKQVYKEMEHAWKDGTCGPNGCIVWVGNPETEPVKEILDF
jgi:hypothetical protein